MEKEKSPSRPVSSYSFYIWEKLDFLIENENPEPYIFVRNWLT
jgi:hypothetical protein